MTERESARGGDVRRVGAVLALACAAAALAPTAARAQAASPPSPADDEEVVVDRVVAVVGATGDRGRDLRIVTAYELQVETLLVIAERTHSIAVAQVGHPTDRLLDAVLQTVVSQILIEEEAAGLDLVALNDAEVAAERDALEQRLGGAGALERFRQAVEAPPELIDAILRRRAVVASFVRRNIQIGASVTDYDVEQAYRSGNHPFGNRPLEEIRPALEAYLSATRQREQLSRWLQEARRRSRVWIVPP
jgi:hypothetical protein